MQVHCVWQREQSNCTRMHVRMHHELVLIIFSHLSLLLWPPVAIVGQREIISAILKVQQSKDTNWVSHLTKWRRSSLDWSVWRNADVIIAFISLLSGGMPYITRKFVNQFYTLTCHASSYWKISPMVHAIFSPFGTLPNHLPTFLSPVKSTMDKDKFCWIHKNSWCCWSNFYHFGFAVCRMSFNTTVFLFK